MTISTIYVCIHNHDFSRRARDAAIIFSARQTMTIQYISRRARDAAIIFSEARQSSSGHSNTHKYTHTPILQLFTTAGTLTTTSPQSIGTYFQYSDMFLYKVVYSGAAQWASSIRPKLPTHMGASTQASTLQCLLFVRDHGDWLHGKSRASVLRLPANVQVDITVP